MMDWNDLRYFLAVADQGSTLAAGRALRVSQTTVARRVAALEEALGLLLLRSARQGIRADAGGRGAGRPRPASRGGHRRLRRSFGGPGPRFQRYRSDPRKEIFANTLLGPILRELHDIAQVVIEIDTQQELLDLGAGEADIALRSTAGEAPAGLVGRSLCIDDWTLYCSREYADRRGVPRTRKDLLGHAIIGGGGGKLWRHYEAWLKSLGLEGR